MAVTDGYLRSRAKVSSTDGWLHVAGPSGVGPPPFISSSGTVTAILSATSSEALSDLGAVAFVAALSADESLAEAGAALISVLLSGDSPTGVLLPLLISKSLEGRIALDRHGRLPHGFDGRLDLPPAGAQLRRPRKGSVR